jgi:hypothetical protein
VREPEIDEFDGVFLVAEYHDILWLEIAVHDSHQAQVLEC